MIAPGSLGAARPGVRSALRLALLVTLLALPAACYTPPRLVIVPPAPVSAAVVARFRLDESGEQTVPRAPAAWSASDAAADAPTSDARLALFGSAGASTESAQRGSAAAAPGNSDDEPASPDDVLRLDDVLLSVETHFPLVLAAREELEIAAGRLESAQGGFDTRLTGDSRFEREGFYENDRVDVALEQPTPWWGTTFSTGYRIGDGDFAVYDGKAKTNDDGEFRVGATVPLLQGGRIDPRRVALWQARLELGRARPFVEARRLEATFDAAAAYWSWVAAGEEQRIARELLAFAETRQEQVRAAVEEGELAAIDLIDNERLIVDRRARLVSTEQALQRAAIELSLYTRDGGGAPVVPDPTRLPPAFPRPRPPADVLVPDDVELATGRRPELRRIALELQSLGLDLELARNRILPRLDVGLFASQDYGAAVNTPDDKGELELEATLRFALPLQQRGARGERRAATARIARLEQEYRFERDRIANEVRDASAVLVGTWERLDQARRNVELARALEEAEREQLALGQSDLFRVNLREQQTAVAAVGLVDVTAQHFRALAAYRAVLGIPYDEVVAGERVGGGA